MYKKYEDELKFMVTKLDEFVMDCTVKIFEAEDIKQDAIDDDIFHKMKRSLEALTNMAEHHLGGAKGAKLRFQSM